MQSLLFSGLVLLAVCVFGNAVPVNVDAVQVNVDQLSGENDSETRLIVPPEMTSNYFELLKVKSEKDTNSTKAEKTDSTPMNFLRSSDDSPKNTSSTALKPILAFDGSKQQPIFITIPIYITSSNEDVPIIATSIEKIAPSQIPSTHLPKGSVETEDKSKQESSSSLSSVDGNKQEQDKN